MAMEKRSSRVIAVAAIILMVAVGIFLSLDAHHEHDRKPLYWVSQMDPNYRSSAPGKCPHGMDLIPIYAENLTAHNDDPGVVRISAEVQQQMGVRKAQVEFGTLKKALRVYGRVVADPTLVSKITPRVKGWVDLLFVHAPGELVKRGQPLFALYSPELIAAQESFLKALATGNKSAILRSEAELYALNMDDLAIAQLKNDGVPQRSVIFRAPKDGMVDVLKIREGDYVRPREMMLAVGSMENVWLELEVFESQASLIKPGQALTFTTPAHPGIVWEAEIDSLYPHLESSSRSQRFRAKIENIRMLLRPNMQVEALIILPAREPALLVPHSAVINLGAENRVVLDMGEGRFKSVHVVVGESNSEQIEIFEGLQEHDTVVASAHFLIDSESSRTSDFLRMTPLTENADFLPTWVNATIKDIQLEERIISLQHERVDDWNMPAMTMDFKVAEDIDMQWLKNGLRVRARIAVGDPLLQILAIQGDIP